jgi:OmcA/MtrC family decaheme c-type cytochrome
VSFGFVLASLIGLVGTVTLIGGSKPRYTPHDRSYYLSQDLAAFVLPGLNLKIQGVALSSLPAVTVTFRISDDSGLGLDRLGVVTPGPVSFNFVIARIKPGDTQYGSYVLRPETNDDTGITKILPLAENDGTFTDQGDGVYQYTFSTQLPADFEKNATHTVGIMATRDLSQFDLGTSVANAVFSFVPSGAAVTQVRDVVSTAACNQCHDPLAAHGGERTDIRVCVLCHQLQNSDLSSINHSLDFKVFIHKIHMGANMPSVSGRPLNVLGTSGSATTGAAASGATQGPLPGGWQPPGTPYQIITDDSLDASAIVLPQDIRNCTTCHQNASQADNWKTKPSRAACGSCHDDVNFATGENHVNLPEFDDNLCATCHSPQGETEFDASVVGAHTIPTASQQLPGTTLSIMSVTDTSPGQQPTVTFSVKDRSGNAIEASKMDYLDLILAGPTTDYANVWSEDARKATLSGGAFVYTFSQAIPKGAKGSFAVAIEGYRNVTLNPGTVKQIMARDAGFNQVTYFSVDNSEVAPRRVVVSLDNCNACHKTLALHGIRRNTEACVLCHNPNATDAATRPHDQTPAQGIHLKTLIHRIHADTDDVVDDLTVFGFNGSPIDYNGVHFPGDRRNCAECHVNNSQELPLPNGLLPTVSPRALIPVMPPIQAACLACHATKSAAAHAATSTTVLGESCEVCHGTDAEFAIDKVHAR